MNTEPDYLKQAARYVAEGAMSIQHARPSAEMREWVTEHGGTTVARELQESLMGQVRAVFGLADSAEAAASAARTTRVLEKLDMTPAAIAAANSYITGLLQEALRRHQTGADTKASSTAKAAREEQAATNQRVQAVRLAAKAKSEDGQLVLDTVQHWPRVNTEKSVRLLLDLCSITPRSHHAAQRALLTRLQKYAQYNQALAMSLALYSKSLGDVPAMQAAIPLLEEHMLRSNEDDEEHARLARALGTLYNATGQEHKTEQLVQKELRQAEAGLEHTLAVAVRRRGRPFHAIALLTNEDGSPKYPNNWYRTSTLATAYYNTKQYDKAAGLLVDESGRPLWPDMVRSPHVIELALGALWASNRRVHALALLQSCSDRFIIDNKQLYASMVHILIMLGDQGAARAIQQAHGAADFTLLPRTWQTARVEA